MSGTRTNTTDDEVIFSASPLLLIASIPLAALTGFRTVMVLMVAALPFLTLASAASCLVNADLASRRGRFEHAMTWLLAGIMGLGLLGCEIHGMVKIYFLLQHPFAK